LTAEGIIKIYTAMKVDAAAVAPLDLAAGLEILLTSRKQGFPWLSANLLDQKGRPLFEPVRIKKIGKIKAGIIGLTGTVRTLPAGVTLADWRTILPALIKKTDRQCDILILLSSLSAAENQEIAQQFPAIHLILAANPDSGNMNPQQINNSLITQTGRQGKYQGILTIDWTKSGKWGKSREEELTTLRNRLGSFDWQLQRMQKTKDSQQPEYLDKIKLVEQNRETVIQQIKTLEAQGADPGNGKNTMCSFSFNFVALNQSMPDDPEIRAIITEIKQQINDLRHKLAQKEVNLPFLGHEGCKTCHLRQTAFWQTTNHSQAWETLKNRNQARNLECLPCHVITSRELVLSRDQLLSLPKSLQAVGCENCHTGPGKSHATSPDRFAMTRQVEEKICLGCHTPEHDNHFEYQEKLTLIACPAS